MMTSTHLTLFERQQDRTLPSDKEAGHSEPDAFAKTAEGGRHVCYDRAMKQNWNYQDSIDLEYFLKQDEALSPATLHERDRKLFLEKVEPQVKEDPRSPSPLRLIGLWLDARRGGEPLETGLPGRLAGESIGLLRLILALIGLTLGASSGSLFFSYTGKTPVNVLDFLVLFVFSQILLVTVLFLRTALLRIFRISMPRTLLVRLVALLSTRLYRFFNRHGQTALGAGHTDAMQAAFGRLRGFGTVHGPLFFWPLFLLIQVIGICFNIGLLGASLMRITISDVAFGWQSTLQFSAKSLHAAIHVLALPWCWALGEGTGYPTFSQIEGSRIILKEGISHLTTANLVSWWPFLLMSVLVYGLGARLLLYSYGYWQQRKASHDPDAAGPAAWQILQRMQTPVVSTRAQRPEAARREEAAPAVEKAVPPKAGLLLPAHLLLPDEIHDQCLAQPLDDLLAQEGYGILKRHRFLVDYESDRDLLEELAAENWGNGGGIIILMEAWMPPLIDFLTFLRELRQRVGAKLPILLRLVGRPAPDCILTPVGDPTQQEVWRRKIDGLGDPYLQVTPLMAEESP
jgi:hypothetical protein